VSFHEITVPQALRAFTRYPPLGPVPRKDEPTTTTSGKHRPVGRVPLSRSRPQRSNVPANPRAPTRGRDHSPKSERRRYGAVLESAGGVSSTPLQASSDFGHRNRTLTNFVNSMKGAPVDLDNINRKLDVLITSTIDSTKFALILPFFFTFAGVALVMASIFML
jgi:hypothetical protein